MLVKYIWVFFSIFKKSEALKGRFVGNSIAMLAYKYADSEDLAICINL